MKVSAKGIYAAVIMLDILEYGKASPVVIKEVAAREDIPNKYAEQVVGILSAAGLVKSARGPKGGYRATDKAQKSTIGTILRLTEGVLKEQDLEIDNPCLDIVFKDLKAAVDEALDRYTLPQLLEMKQEAGNNYVI